ncbi:TetR family transcriptional regulator [Pseudomonas aeruginosa]|nr:TetR family transcriptional regulator [Pseudomonas aeruginosa]MDF5955088.1 TetR family transcriptional regulator [Pseudomonas aeruginosa]
MSDMNETKDRVADAPGKRALLEAALRLGSSSRSLGAIGLRELAREAGLNPNTFYRHFRDIDDLGLTMIRDISTQLRQPLRQLAARPRLVRRPAPERRRRRSGWTWKGGGGSAGRRCGCSSTSWRAIPPRSSSACANCMGLRRCCVVPCVRSWMSSPRTCRRTSSNSGCCRR